jgi:hypothetical protein
MLSVIALVGTILADGVPCARMQLEDGRRVWISGLPADIDPGDTVSLTGTWGILRNCQAKAFIVDSVQVLNPPSTPRD